MNEPSNDQAARRAGLLAHLARLDREPPNVVGRWTRDELHDRRGGLSAAAFAAGGGGRAIVSASGGQGLA